MAHRIVVLRHGIDTGVGERELAPGEREDLVRIVQPQVWNALGGKGDALYSSPLLRAVATASAIGSSEPTTRPELGEYPKYSDAVMAYAKLHGIDSSAAFFAVEGAESATLLGKKHGGHKLLCFIEEIHAHTEYKRVLIVVHGGAMEYVASAFGARFPPEAPFARGEGFWIDANDLDGMSLGGFIRR